MQPSAWISAFGFTFTAWGNVPMTGASEGAGLQSGGLILTYDRDWEKLKIEAALDTYTGPQSLDIESRNTMEGSLKLSYPVGRYAYSPPTPLTFWLIGAHTLARPDLEYERQVKKNTEFTVTVRSGWASAKFNDVYIGVNKSAFNYIGVEGSLTYYLGRRMYIRPHIEFSSITDRRLREQAPRGSTVNFGIAFGFRK